MILLLLNQKSPTIGKNAPQVGEIVVNGSNTPSFNTV